MTWLWHWLRRPWLAIFAGFVGVMLILAVWQLPQLPGQLVDEQAAAATWLLNTSSAYGIWGNAFLALGLFDVLRSPMLYLLLALLVPTLAAQLADQLGAVDQQRSVHPTAHDADVQSGLRELMDRVDVIVLAQATMARVADQIPVEERRVPILSSPRSGLLRARETLFAV